MADERVKQAAKAVAALNDANKIASDDLQPANNKAALEMPHYANMVKLIAADNQMFYVDFESACVSGTVALAMDTCGYTKDSADIEIPLSNVTGPVLMIIMQWMRYHRNPDQHQYGVENPQFGRWTHMTNLAQYRCSWILPSLTRWECKFVSEVVGESRLLQVYRAAHYMDIEGLARACAKIIAISIRDKGAARYRNILEQS